MEHWLHPRLQMHGHHGLGDAVGDGRNPQGSGAAAVLFRYLHRLDRGREVTARRHPIPDLVQVVLQVGFELCDGPPIDTRSAAVLLDPLERLPEPPRV